MEPAPFLSFPPLESKKLKADRERLAALLVDLARCINQDLATKVPSFAADPRLEELRHIIAGRERTALDELQRQFEDPEQLAAAVSRVLAPAVVQAATRDERLGQALAPMVESAAQLSIKKNPRTLVNILYPLMGPAIRKSIGETLEGSVRSLNEMLKYSLSWQGYEMLKYSLSWQGLKWRVEAYRTGTPFAEIVLRHTLVYRVEHVLLIHRHTGLLLEHVAADPLTTRDPQLVSGMLTAIQDFVRDSFSETGGTGLDAVRLGELLLWCVESPYAFLVAVIRGSPPEHLRELLRDALAKIHAEKHHALESFDGDTAGFSDIRDLLADCLRAKEKPREQATSPFLRLLLLLPIAILLVGGYWLYERRQESRQWSQYIQRLQGEPGIVVIGSEKRDGKWHVTGLRDPLAVEPTELLAGFSLAPAQVVGHWEPYQGLNPNIVLRRIQASLDPLPSISLTVENNTIRARGSAPHLWVEQARMVGRLMPSGSPPLDLTLVEDIDKAALERLRNSIQARLIYFDKDAPTPASGQEQLIAALAAELRELAEVSRQLRLAVRATVIGHADSSGRETSNLALSIGRAEVVRSLLKSQGVDPDLLSVRGAGRLEPLSVESSGEDRNRRVSLTVSISD